MTRLPPRLTGGLRLIPAPAVAYLTSPFLLAIAAVPAALRAYQSFSGDDNGWLELIVELLRVVLIAAMIATGRGWNVALVFTADAWRLVGADMSHAVRTGWPAILVALVAVTLAALAVDTALTTIIDHDTVRALLDAVHLHAVPARQTADAVTFAIKNVVVIPLCLMTTLYSIRAACPA